MLSAEDIKDLVNGGEGNVDFKWSVPSKVRELIEEHKGKSDGEWVVKSDKDSIIGL